MAPDAACAAAQSHCCVGGPPRPPWRRSRGQGGGRGGNGKDWEVGAAARVDGGGPGATRRVLQLPLANALTSSWRRRRRPQRRRRPLRLWQARRRHQRRGRQRRRPGLTLRCGHRNRVARVSTTRPAGVVGAKTCRGSPQQFLHHNRATCTGLSCAYWGSHRSIVGGSALALICEASSRDPFVFSTLRQPRCTEWMALFGLMVTL